MSTVATVCVRYYFVKDGVYRAGTDLPDFHGAAKIVVSDVYYCENAGGNLDWDTILNNNK